MDSGMREAPGHSNRVFSLHFYQEDPSMILTGGWDGTVHFWDVRAGLAVRMLFGPDIHGEALDVASDIIMTGS